MVFPIVKGYVKQKTNQDEETILSILNKYSSLPALGKNKVIITRLAASLSAINANSTFYRTICVSGGWAVQLVSYDNPETQNAFYVTIGHELGHKEKQYNRILHPLDLRFLSWTIETNCDFFGAKKMINGSRKDFIASINYKISLKNIQSEDKKPILHPTWKHRLIYATNFDFNDELIEKIKADTECTNYKLVQKVKEFYKDKHIILK